MHTGFILENGISSHAAKKGSFGNTFFQKNPGHIFNNAKRGSVQKPNGSVA